MGTLPTRICWAVDADLRTKCHPLGTKIIISFTYMGIPLMPTPLPPDSAVAFICWSDGVGAGSLRSSRQSKAVDTPQETATQPRISQKFVSSTMRRPRSSAVLLLVCFLLTSAKATHCILLASTPAGFSPTMPQLQSSEAPFKVILSHDAADVLLDRLMRDLRNNPFDRSFGAALPGGTLLSALSPCAAAGRTKLRRRLESLPHLDAPTLAESFYQSLPSLLYPLCMRTLVLELHVARVQGQLSTPSPEGRYQSFVDMLSSYDSVILLMREYPRLLACLYQRLDDAAAAFAEAVERFVGDRAALEKALPGVDLQLLALEPYHGDRHHQGRSVFKVQCAGIALAYRPRPSAALARFQDALTWLGAQPGVPSMRTLRLVETPTHAWVEWVALKDCVDESEVHEFYRRQGASLALLHVLGAVDFHEENVLAHGAFPVFFDVETLFHPNAIASTVDPHSAAGVFNASVMSVGLLPQRLRVDGEVKQGVTVGGLSEADGDERASLVLVDAHKDTMRFELGRVKVGRASNVPSLRGVTPPPQHFVADLNQGFGAAYGAIAEHRNGEFAALAQSFGNASMRVLVRSTVVYGELLQASHHPDFMRDFEAAEALWSKLKSPQRTGLLWASLMAEELAALRRGDIPFFQTTPQDLDFVSCSQHTVRQALEMSGLQLVRQRLAQLSPKDLAWQQWLIEASFASFKPNSTLTSTDTVNLPVSTQTLDRFRYQAAAERMVDLLRERAHGPSHAPGWVTLVGKGEAELALEPAPLDFYDGLSGIAVFFAFLAKTSGRPADVATTEALLRLLRSADLSRLHGAGAYQGPAGHLYALVLLAQATQDTFWLNQAADGVDAAMASLAKRPALDVLSGAAGTGLALLALSKHKPSSSLTAALQQVGALLVRAAQHSPLGVQWITQPGMPAHSGMAHGNGGISTALYQLGRTLGQPEWLDVARAGFRYENTLRSAVSGQWISWIQDEQGQPVADERLARWCYGAPGVAASRLPLLDGNPDDVRLAPEDLALAHQASKAAAYGASHCLCHGDLGTLDIFFCAARKLSNTQWHGELESITAWSLSTLESTGPVCGNVAGVVTPGLLTGVAGVGFGLLRLMAPALIPNLLLVETCR